MKNKSLFRVFADGEPTANTTVKHLSLSSLPYEGKVGIGSFPTVGRRSNYSSSTCVYPSSLRGRTKVGLFRRVAMLLFVMFLAIPQMWGATAGMGTYVTNQKPGSDTKFCKLGDGVYFWRQGTSSFDNTYGAKMSDKTYAPGVVLALSGSTKVSVTTYGKAANNNALYTFKVFEMTSDEYALFEKGSNNSTKVARNTFAKNDASVTKKSGAIIKGALITELGVFKSGYYFIEVTIGDSPTSNDYLQNIILAAGSDTPECPENLTISGTKDYLQGDKIELSASLEKGNGEISYQWYKGSVAAGNEIADATSDKLTINSCALTDAGDYFCVASKADCEDAVNASAFAITVAEDPRCAYMPTLTSQPASLDAITTIGMTLSNNNPNKVVEMNKNGIKLGGDAAQLKVTLSSSTIVEGTKITIKSKGGDKTGIGVFNGEMQSQVINATSIKGDNTQTHTFTAAEVANYVNEFVITRNGTGASNYIYEITVENCGGELVYHTVSFDMNGATSTAIESQNVIDGKKATKPADPEKDGVDFDKWVVSSSSAEYNWDAPVTTDVALKATWTTKYALTFVANGGTGSMTAQKYEENAEVTVPACGFTAPANKQFDKWTVTGLDDVTELAPNAKFNMPTNTVTLTAQWKAIPYTGNIFLIGGACTGQGWTLGNAKQLTSDGKGIYTIEDVDIAAVTSGSDDGFKFLTDKSSWEGQLRPLVVNATVYNSDGSYAERIEPNADVQANFLAGSVTPDTKWQLTEDATCTITLDLSDQTACKMTISSIVADKHDLIFEANGGTGSMTTLQKAEGATVTLPACGFTAPAGMMFDKWISDDVTITDGKFVMPTNDVTVKATWVEKDDYAKTVDIEKYVVDNSSVTLDDVKTLLSDKKYTYSNLSGIDRGHTHNYIYDGVKWSKDNNGYIQFDVKAGQLVAVKVGYLKSNTAAKMYIDGTEDATQIKSADESTEKYHIYYWCKEADAQYKLNINSKDAGGTCVLKAITITDPYEVTFVNGGEIDPMYFKGTALTLPAATGEGEFQGWFDAETGGNLIGKAGDSYIPTGNITLYAQFSTCSTNNEIISFTYGETTVNATEGKREYNIELPYGTAIPEELTYVKAEEKATAGEVTKLDNVFSFTVTSECGVGADYTITFTNAPKDGVCLIKGQVTGENKVTITVGEGTGSASAVKNTSTFGGQTGYKLNSRPGYIGIALSDDRHFQAGDVVNVFVTKVADNDSEGNPQPMRLYYGMNTENLMAEGTSAMVQGVNTIVLTDDPETDAIYLCRGEAGKANETWNPYIAYIEVLRPMMPQLTKLVINEIECTKGEGNAFSVTLPNGTDLTSLNVVPTIIANGGEHGEIQGDWAWGANTYRVLDKDNDYTDYTVTLTEDELKYKVSFDTKGGEPAIEDQYVLPNGYPTAVEDPAKEHFVFKGWSETDGGTTAVNITTIQITEDKTFYAIWNEKFMVTFDSKGGTAIDSREIEKGEKVGDVADPEKWDNTFAGWNKQGSSDIIANIAEEVVSSDVTYEANWQEEAGVIKLIDAAGNLNTTDFITGATMQSGTIEYKGVNLNYAKLGGNATSVTGIGSYTNRAIMYNATTTKTKVKVVAKNTSTSTYKIFVWGVVEGATEATALGEYTMTKDEPFAETPYLEYDNALHRTIYITTSASGSVAFLQVKVIAEGETLTKVGEPEYALNLNKGRVVAASGQSTALTFEGISFVLLNSNYTPLSNATLKLTAVTGYCYFAVEKDVQLSVTTNGTKKYYVTNVSDGTDNETTPTAGVANTFDLTPGTWYIRTAGSAVELTNIAFAKPNAPEPEITAISDGTYCEGDAMPELTVTASVTSGELHYQWYKVADSGDVEVGEDATYTPDADATYYVVVTNKKEGYNDASAQSDNVEVKSVAGTSIISAKGGEARDGQTVTLSVEAEGKDLTYAWFACDESGTISGDQLGDDATLEVTIAGADAYYKVLVHGECGEDKFAIVLAKMWVERTQTPVSESTVWDWTKVASSQIKLTDLKNTEVLMANIEGVTNDDTFNSQAIMFYGENVYNVESSVAYASIGHIKLNTTVPGMITVEFADNGSNNRRLSINGQFSESSSSKTDYKTFSAMVDAGEVTLMGVKSDMTGADQYIRVHKITFTAAEKVRSGLTNGKLVTMCQAQPIAKMWGGAAFDVEKKYSVGIELIEANIDEEPLKAGKPYIVLAEAPEVYVLYAEGDAAEAPVSVEEANGLVGNLNTATTNLMLPDGEDTYIFSNNHLCSASGSNGNFAAPDRAYLNYDKVTDQTVVNAAPSRRRISMGGASADTPTDLDAIMSGKNIRKMIINNQLIIIRDGHFFNAQGAKMR